MDWSGIVIAIVTGVFGLGIGIFSMIIRANVNGVKMDGDVKLAKAEIFSDVKDIIVSFKNEFMGFVARTDRRLIDIGGELAYNTEETKKNSLAHAEIKAKTRDENSFYADLMKIGVDAIEDIKKQNKGKGDERANVYINAAIDSLKSFSRDILTIGIENISPEIINSKASSIVQNCNKIYIHLFGEKHAKHYVLDGQEDRNRFIGKIIQLKTDKANNKVNRYQNYAESYAYAFTSAFCRYYYVNHLFEEI